MDSPTEKLPLESWDLAAQQKIIFIVAALICCCTALHSYLSLLKQLATCFPRFLALLITLGSWAFAYFCIDTAFALDSTVNKAILQVARSSLMLGAIYMALGPLVLLRPGSSTTPHRSEKTEGKHVVQTRFGQRCSQAFGNTLGAIILASQGVLLYSLIVVLDGMFSWRPIDTAAIATCYGFLCINHLVAHIDNICPPVPVHLSSFFAAPGRVLQQSIAFLRRPAYRICHVVLTTTIALVCVAFLLAFFIRDVRFFQSEARASSSALAICIVYLIVTIAFLVASVSFLLIAVLKPDTATDGVAGARHGNKLPLRGFFTELKHPDHVLETDEEQPILVSPLPTTSLPTTQLCSFEESRTKLLMHRTSIISTATITPSLAPLEEETSRATDNLHVHVLAHDGIVTGHLHAPTGLCETDAGLLVCDSSASRVVLLPYLPGMMDGEQQARIAFELPLFSPCSIAAVPNGFLLVDGDATMLLHIRHDGSTEWAVSLARRNPTRTESRGDSWQGVAADPLRGHAAVAYVHTVERILVLSPGSSSINVLDALGSRVGQIISQGPIAGLAVGPTGLIYALDRDAGVVFVMDVEGSVLNILDSSHSPAGPLVAPTAIAVDKRGTVVVADATQRRVVRFDSGGQVTAFPLAGVPSDLCVDEKSGCVVVTFSADQLVLAFELPATSSALKRQSQLSSGSMSLHRVGPSGLNDSIIDCNHCFPLGIGRLTSPTVALSPVFLSGLWAAGTFVHKRCELMAMQILTKFFICERQRLATLLRAQLRAIATLQREVQQLKSETDSLRSVSFWSLKDGVDGSVALDTSAVTSTTNGDLGGGGAGLGGAGGAKREELLAMRLEEDERAVTTLRAEINEVTVRAFRCQNRARELQAKEVLVTSARPKERLKLQLGGQDSSGSTEL